MNTYVAADLHQVDLDGESLDFKRTLAAATSQQPKKAKKAKKAKQAKKNKGQATSQQPAAKNKEQRDLYFVWLV